MLERVEADPAELPGGLIAELVCHKAMRGLVEGDGDEEGEDPDGEVVQRNIHVIPLQLKAIGMASRVARLTEISSRWFEMVERK